MSYPILAARDTWYSQGNSGINRNTIKEINIKNSYTPAGAVTAQWDGSAAKDGSITVYIEGTKLTIAGNGSGKIAANADSSFMFSDHASYKTSFGSCSAITGLNLIDTGNVNTLERAFQDGGFTSLDLSSWDVSKVESLKATFQFTTKLTSISVETWNTGKVSDLSFCFNNCKALPTVDISGWNTSSVTDMTAMFQGCKLVNALDVSMWETGNVISLQKAFKGCALLTTLNTASWDVSKVNNMMQTFLGCTNLTTLDVSSWNVSKVTSMEGIFQGCHKIQTLAVSSWNTKNVTSFKSAFSMESSGGGYPAENALTTLDVSNWDTSSAVDMSFMFYGCNQLQSIDVSKWDVSKVKNFDHFACHSRMTINGVENWKNTIVENAGAMCYSWQNTTIDLRGIEFSHAIGMGQMFENSNVENILGIETFNTSSCVDFTEMFNNCERLKKLNLVSFDTRKAKDGIAISANGGISGTLLRMFNGCTSLEELRLGMNFSVDGDGTTTDPTHKLILPAPAMAGADGNWYTANRTAYAPDAIPDGAGTYYATKALADSSPNLVQSGTISNIGDAIREKDGSSAKINPMDMPQKIRAIQTGGPPPVIQPKTITTNGTYTAPSGVDGYSPVTVNCPAPKPEQAKTVEITANGDYPVTPDVGKVLSSVLAKVNVPTGGGGGIEWCHVTTKTSPGGLDFGFYGRGTLDMGKAGKVEFAEGCNGSSGIPSSYADASTDLYVPKYSTIVFTNAYQQNPVGIAFDNADAAEYGIYYISANQQGATVFIKGDVNITISTK